MTTKIQKPQGKTTLWVEHLPSDRNIILIVQNGMLIGINYWQGIGDNLFTEYNRTDERLTKFIMPSFFGLFDTEWVLPSPNYDEMIEFIDEKIWDYLERDDKTIALNSIGHWLYGDSMYPMYNSDGGLLLPCEFNDDERIRIDEITHWAFDQMSERDMIVLKAYAPTHVVHRIETLINQPKTTYYYLVGTEAVSTYPDIHKLDPMDGDVICFDTEKMTPTQLLEMIDGWMDFIEITEEEYNEIYSILYK